MTDKPITLPFPPASAHPTGKGSETLAGKDSDQRTAPPAPAVAAHPPRNSKDSHQPTDNGSDVEAPESVGLHPARLDWRAGGASAGVGDAPAVIVATAVAHGAILPLHTHMRAHAHARALVQSRTHPQLILLTHAHAQSHVQFHSHTQTPGARNHRFGSGGGGSSGVSGQRWQHVPCQIVVGGGRGGSYYGGDRVCGKGHRYPSHSGPGWRSWARSRCRQ